MNHPPLRQRDLYPHVSPKAQEVMYRLIQAWALYETTLTSFMMAAFRLPLDEGSILFGNMDTRTKLDRLKALYQHYDMKDAVKSIAHISSLHGKFVGMRNAVAHFVCDGHLKKDPNYLVFSGAKHLKGSRNAVLCEVYKTDAMVHAVAFAGAVSIGLIDILMKQRTRRAKPPIAPPSVVLRSRPIPHKNGRGKREKQRPKPPA